MDSCTPSNFSSSLNFSSICKYVTYYNGCALTSGFINYFQWQYCSFDNRWLPAIFMFIWFLYLLIGVASAADGFLAPCLVIVSKTLRMSQNLAGVTLLALGNGAAEVFTSLSAIVSVNNPNVGLALGGILGAGIMVNTITAGIIIIIAPFEAMHRPIIKDLVFYLISLLWTMFIFIRRQIELWSSLIFLIIYAIYILVTVISRLLYVKKQKSKRVNIEITVTPPSDTNETQDIECNERKLLTTSSILSKFKSKFNSIKSYLRFIRKSNAPEDLNKHSNGYDNPNYISDIQITVTPPSDTNETQDIENNDRKLSATSSILSTFKDGFNSFESHLRFSQISNPSEDLNKHSNGYDNSNYISDIKITITPAVDEVEPVEANSRSSSISDFFPYNFHEKNANNSRNSSTNGNFNKNNKGQIYSNNSNKENPENISKYHLNVPKISHQSKSSIDNITKDSNDKHSNHINNSIKQFTTPSQSRKVSEISSISSYNSKYDLSKKRLSVNRKNSIMRSTSHRSIGSFANIIIDNEKQSKLLEKISEKNVIRTNQFRSYSMTIISETPPITKTRSWSQSDDTKKQPDGNITNDKEEYRTNSFSKDDIKSDLYGDDEIDEPVFPGTWKHLLWTIVPVDLDEWKEQSVPSKIFSVLQIPYVLVFTLTVPVVDEKALMKGWCKILNCIHCVLSPITWTIMANVFLTKFGNSNFILIYLFLIIGIIITIAVAFTSTVDKPPIYHPAFAFIGLITSVLWIYEISNEIVNVLSVFGVVFSISEVILGLSVLAIANSISDLVSDIALARKNYPRIGYTGCIGSPLFGLLIGIGLPFTIKTMTGPVQIPLTATSIVLIFTILLITTMNLICLPLMKFRPKRFYGILLICIFVVYFILIILFAANVIKVSV